MPENTEDLFNVPFVDLDYDDPDRIFTRMLEEIQQKERISLLALTFPVEEEKNTCVTLSLSGGKTNWESRRFNNPESEPDIATIISGKPKATNDFTGTGNTDWERIRGWVEGATSAICVPLVHEEKVFGCATAIRNNGAEAASENAIEQLALALKPYSVSIYVTRIMRMWIKKISHINSLIHVSTLISSSLDLDQILEYALITASSISNAEASSLLLLDEESQRAYFKAAIGARADELKNYHLEPGEGVAGWVALHGRPLNVPDVTVEPRFSSRIADAVDFPVRNMLCVPLKVKKKTLGALEVLNKKDDAAGFDWMDMTSLIAIANQAAVSIENSRLYMDAITDPLTGVYSRRFYQNQFRKEAEKAKRSGTNLSLLVFDIDNFKIFNDTYGHETGDVVLQKVAGIIKNNLRLSDTAARYGGEEFVVILPDTDREDAKMIAERIRARIAAATIDNRDEDIFVTISGGAATYPLDTNRYENLFFQADHAMYVAKQAGKNIIKTSADSA